MYKVLDKYGVAYTDTGGRKVLQCGNMLTDNLIANHCFTEGGIEKLIKDGRIEEVKVVKTKEEKEADKKAEAEADKEKKAKDKADKELAKKGLPASPMTSDNKLGKNKDAK